MCPSVFLPKMWNDISTEIKNTLELNSAKNKMKKIIFSSYETDNISCDYVNCPDCRK